MSFLIDMTRNQFMPSKIIEAQDQLVCSTIDVSAKIDHGLNLDVFRPNLIANFMINKTTTIWAWPN